MIGWIFKRRKDAALFRVIRIGRQSPYWRIQEIETGEMLLVTAAGLTRSPRWSAVGAARSPVGQG